MCERVPVRTGSIIAFHLPSQRWPVLMFAEPRLRSMAVAWSVALSVALPVAFSGACIALRSARTGP